MPYTTAPTTKKSDEETRKSQRRQRSWIPWLPWLPRNHFLFALGAVGLTVYYLLWVTPELVPVPPGVKVPFPAATQFLEGVCQWCTSHRLGVILMATGVLGFGLFLRISARRYYFWVGVLTTVCLSFTYLSISAPIDRLLRSVEEALPPERQFPDYVPAAPEGE